MKLFLTLLVVFAIGAFAEKVKLDPEFAEYIVKFKKEYTLEELPIRMAVFKASLNRIQNLRKQAAREGHDTKYDVNKFSDLTPAEFKSKYLGYRKSQIQVKAPLWVPITVELPTSMDWRTKGAVTPIKNQGQCGSCWAFSATEGVESAWFLSGKTLTSLSPQQIVSCDTTDGGCNGGDLPTAFAYVQSAGLESDAAYPYTSGNGDSGTCQYDQSDVVAQISGFQYATQSNNETAMQAASLTNGPLSVCVDASSWQDYSGGVLTSCTDSLDHCVQIVGWDQTSDGTPYWIVKNSWGTDWGLSGYIWIVRNQDMCGIAEEATFVTI